MKKFFVVLTSVLIIGYLIFSVVYFGGSSDGEKCTRLEVIVKDSARTQFIRQKDIDDLLRKNKLHPVGEKMSEINTLQIHETVMSNKLVKSAQVYAAPNGLIVVNIRQREPVLRVISNMKGSFYIDNNRERMPVSENFTAYLPLATGAIDEEFAGNELYDFVNFLHNNPEWDAWVEQIEVRSNRDVVLIPRAGDFKIVFGKPENHAEKFARFALFIEKGLNVLGWDRYSEISLKYDNQIVCTKK